MFSSLDMIKKMGITLTLNDYKRVYKGECECRGGIDRTLESLFIRFNGRQLPEGFKGHSLSVSDVIEIDNTFYYCDSFGFEPIELKFKKYPKQKEEFAI